MHWSRGRSVLLMAVACVSLVVAQSTKRFEVASIKPSLPDSGTETRRYPGGRFTATGTTLKRLIQRAYDVQDFQVVGGPKWVVTDRYDVVAKAGENLGTDPNIDLLIQTLLAERFQLKLHRETRETLLYSLTVDKSGPKLTASTTEGGSQWSLGRGLLTGKRVSMSMFASDMLTKAMANVVVDRTAIPGKFDVELKWFPDEVHPESDAERSAGSGPSIFTAIREQLGLRLEGHKGPVDVLVIDAAERPAAN